MLDRTRVPLLSSVLVATAIAGCITVHVYFPVKELKEAADEIVEDVRPDIVSVEEPTSGSEPEEPPGQEDAGDHRTGGADGVGERVGALPAGPALLPVSLIASAWAEESDSQEESEESEESDKVINASSPKITKIKASLKARYKKLLPLYVAGRIGEGLDGYLAAREVGDLGLKERRGVSTLLKAENADRKNLYTTIARENKIAEEKVPDIGRLFSRSWQKSSKTGWWIEIKKGKWVKKPKEPEKKKAPAAEKTAGSA